MIAQTWRCSIFRPTEVKGERWCITFPLFYFIINIIDKEILPSNIFIWEDYSFVIIWRIDIESLDTISGRVSYVYCITNIVNGRKYIGSHTGRIDDDYLGSGVIIKQAVRKYGKDKFVKDILWVGNSKYMRDIETYWCEYFNTGNNPLFYNRTSKGTGYEFGKPNPKLSEVRRSMNIIAWNKGLTKETNNSVRKYSEKLVGKPSGMKGKPAWNKGKPGTMLGKKHKPESYAKLFWERPKIECEICNLKIGINNINRHRRAKHGFE